MEISKNPALQDAYNSFYASMQDDMKRNDEAVKAAAQDQDNPNTDATQQSS